MKSIICYGDSNTWGADPSNPQRFAPDVRWTGVLANQLGSGYRIIEEGLNGRTTVIDELGEANRNGLTYLLPCIDSHHPFDLIVIMLGTNDVKYRHNRQAADIADSVSLLADIVRSSAFGPGGAAPAVLIVCPPPIGKLTDLDGIFAGAAEKTLQMPRYYEWAARRTDSGFLNAGEHIRSSDADGVHFDAENHEKLGIAVANKIREMLSGS
jgi:lysophospholipase L1-like esterase